MMDRPATPPLDGSVRVFPGFTDFHHAHNPRRTCARFAREDTGEIVHATFEEFARASHRIARALHADSSRKNGEVVALIALCDTLMYMALLVGMTRAGLVLRCDIAIPYITAELSFRYPSSALKDVEFVAKGYDLEIIEIPAFTDAFPLLGKETSDDHFEPFELKDWSPNFDDPILYLHSSGSTGFPKPIMQTHRTVLHWCSMLMTEVLYHPREMVWGAVMAPTFHTFGLYMQMYTNFVTGYATVVFQSKYPGPPVMPTPENTLEALKKSGVNTAIAVPSFFEAWAHSPEAIDFLTSMEICTFAGGPLSTKAGDTLVARGVKLNTTYGGTEFGGPSHLYDIIPECKSPGMIPKSLKDRALVRMSDRMKVRWINQGDGTYELQMLTNEKHQPSVENVPDTKGYATSDLWEMHPTIAGLWRLVGRTDDVLVLASGEKTVPPPMEGHILHNPLVQRTLMFGRGRDQVGVLIEPKTAHAIDPKDEEAVIEFRNRIWPTVEEANKNAPEFGRIFKEMILITDPAKPMARAAKGTVQRKLTLALYAEEIDALYDTVDSSMYVEGATPPAAWTHIRATRDLIHFALTSKYGPQVKFLFTSSITVAQSWDASKGLFPEEILPVPEPAVGGGYGEGKYVVERVLSAAASETGLQSTVLRIGQICGGLPDGAWATADCVSILVKSSIAFGCLPDSQGTVSWLSMQAVAKTILDVGLASGKHHLAVNLVHPTPVKWTNIMIAIRKSLDKSPESLPLVPFGEWVKKLEQRATKATAEDLERVPAIRILDFFRKLAGAKTSSGEAGGVAAFATEKARADSPTLKQLQCLDEQDTEMWVKYWMSRAFI
ncbi:acetyl-CoA synthetase-like protein [Neolentinus lepideus HHB14362 ss-1]|uniref:Acetyl-CoA synthetase-like protein n=1 Tax=Neolentinus lepideus HHB14362 ss-1 TaxID=1314782 RepID=A0A165T009_9AGAM|nr:acetyl-CoA synthetase-like protein [Neolentinus lepideus HHB14362 ss-1]